MAAEDDAALDDLREAVRAPVSCSPSPVLPSGTGPPPAGSSVIIGTRPNGSGQFADVPVGQHEVVPAGRAVPDQDP